MSAQTPNNELPKEYLNTTKNQKHYHKRVDMWIFLAHLSGLSFFYIGMWNILIYTIILIGAMYFVGEERT